MTTQTATEQDIRNNIKVLENNGFNFIETYFNGEVGFWGMNKERNTQIIIKLNEMFIDDEVIEEFNNQLKEQENIKK